MCSILFVASRAGLGAAALCHKPRLETWKKCCKLRSPVTIPGCYYAKFIPGCMQHFIDDAEFLGLLSCDKPGCIALPTTGCITKICWTYSVNLFLIKTHVTYEIKRLQLLAKNGSHNSWNVHVKVTPPEEFCKTFSFHNENEMKISFKAQNDHSISYIVHHYLFLAILIQHRPRDSFIASPTKANKKNLKTSGVRDVSRAS